METCRWSLIGEPEKGRGGEEEESHGWWDEGKEVGAMVEITQEKYQARMLQLKKML